MLVIKMQLFYIIKFLKTSENFEKLLGQQVPKKKMVCQNLTILIFMNIFRLKLNIVRLRSKNRKKTLTKLIAVGQYYEIHKKKKKLKNNALS